MNISSGNLNLKLLKKKKKKMTQLLVQIAIT